MEFIEVSAKTVDDAITEASIKLGTTSDKIEVEVIEKGSTGFLGIKSKPAIIKARKKNDTVDNIREFLENVFSAMNMEVTIDIKKAEDDKVYEVELSGKEMGLLIGKRGQTLDSLQYLTNLAVNKHSDGYIKVKLDTEDYNRYINELKPDDKVAPSERLLRRTLVDKEQTPALNALFDQGLAVEMAGWLAQEFRPQVEILVKK